MTSECPTNHDIPSLILGLSLFLGLFISYLPQHYRIISTGSSLGFSPWFLLLGLMGAWSNVINILILQSDVIGCCTSISVGLCLESLLGILQILIVWSMFSGIVVLFVMYFPENLKYQATIPNVPMRDWRDTQVVLWIIGIFHACAAVAFVPLLLGYEEVARWCAGVFGVLSMVVAVVQYLPQLFKTWESKMVGALSIPTMVMQSPGSFLLAYSLAIRPGVNWTSWITYFVSGTLQGILLFMCIAWSLRESRMHASGPHQSGYGPILSQEQDPASGGLYWEDSMVEDEEDSIVRQEEVVD
jgi:uncharacterized protein with PQ loop repeat